VTSNDWASSYAALDEKRLDLIRFLADMSIELANARFHIMEFSQGDPTEIVDRTERMLDRAWVVLNTGEVPKEKKERNSESPSPTGSEP
jgi:hypothetical protein